MDWKSIGLVWRTESPQVVLAFYNKITVIIFVWISMML